MKGALINVFLIAAVLLSPVKAFSAGTVKYMNVMSIYSDEKGAGLKSPEGVACDESRVVIADTANHRLLQYKLEDRTLTEVAEIVMPQVTYPVLVKLNSKSEIFALDGRQRRIARLSREGVFKGYVEPAGLPSPEAYVPKSFEIDKEDNIYILDVFSERVIILNPEGAYQSQIKFPKGHGFFSGIAVDFKGNVLLIDSINARVYSSAKGSEGFATLTESMKEQMRFPTGLTTDNRGRIYLMDRNGSRIIVVGQDGSFLGQMSELGWKEGLLNYPSQMCVNANGEVFVADTNNNRVQVFILLK
ncbi:MAG: NHL repeat-containing protein [Nitrospirae bacterium]|nr:NHL repeat-containing protein [Nitrospirota bacterium]